MEVRGEIEKSNSVVIIIDVQERLYPHIYKKSEIKKNLKKIIEFSKNNCHSDNSN